MRIMPGLPEPGKQTNTQPMPLFTAKVDVDGPLRGMESLRKDQIPFTIARALTMTAQAGQAAARGLEQRVFKLRNDWTVRNTKIAAATKQTLTAQVFTDTENRSTGAKDYLKDQQSGGERVPIGGRQHRAVPTKYLRRMAPGIIPDELRPRALLQYAQLGGKRVTRRGGLRGQSGAIRGMIFFLATTHSGTLCIMGRYLTDREAYPMYLLIPDAHLRPIFPMEPTVVSVAQAAFPENFKRAAAEVMANDLMRGSGLQVRI